MGESISLADLEVLILDCQATGANPANAFLTETGWLRTRASDPWESIEISLESHLCQLPEGVDIPRRVARITGIKTEDLGAGLLPGDIWAKLMTAAGEIAANNPSGICPTIIHFARYEEPYLRYLHQEYTPQETFPFEIICTHQVSLRMLPGLPRKSLRAIAGYFGYSVPELRRSAHHIAATAFIWRQVVRLLGEKDVYTWAEVKKWLKNTSAKNVAGGREYLLEASLRLNIPKKPGIYMMSRSNGDLLYIGKATSLKHRVNSYFYKGKRRNVHANHIMEMLTQAAHLEVIVTGSALEAALLEADEIKKHAPPYNIALRQRERDVAFFSRDLSEPSPCADPSHPIGPLTNGKSIPTFAALAALLDGRLAGLEDTAIASLSLGIPLEYLPEMTCFWEGVEIFRQRHSEILKDARGQFLIKTLMRLGKQLHLKKLAEQEQAAAASTPSEEQRDEESAAASTPSEEQSDEESAVDTETTIEENLEVERPAWTPAGTADVLEGVVRHGALLIRRSGWFCLLSEAALAWITGKTAGENRRLLIFQGGKMIHREDIEPGSPIPSPPGNRESFARRRQNFDLMTYDRMRVLTTELRRLVSAETDRDVQLRLKPGVVLKRKQLQELLRWV